MIAVVAEPSDYPVVREFFELFKTPWELYQKGRSYDVLLCAGALDYNAADAKLILLYSSHGLALDAVHGIKIAGRRERSVLCHYELRIPISGSFLTFQGETDGQRLLAEDTREAASWSYSSSKGLVERIGYDLLDEIRTLLTVGQPAQYAGIPTLEVHIALLRELIVSAGVVLVEIPPVPAGYRFIACLTHDVDHPSIRRHKLDHTALGFLARATFGSIKGFLNGSCSIRDVLTNWAAALRLPLVHLGLAEDFWSDFGERYRRVEKDSSSTYFVLPFKNRPGKGQHGNAPDYRASRYGAQDIADSIKSLVIAGSEIGLHGIDAWVDGSSGREEIKEIRDLTGSPEVGVRMHWLYFDKHSAAKLESAGAAFDSTVGYREVVGFRAGTTQVYKPFDAERLLELPMHVMDTALFYPAYMGLRPKEASELLRRITDQVDEFGGCLTINWHDRSLAPERLWCECYFRLLKDLKTRGAWFATAGQAVAWFRKRRSAQFDCHSAALRPQLQDTCRSDDCDVLGLEVRALPAQSLVRHLRAGRDCPN